MDNDDIEDFYYEQGYDEDDNNVGVELGRPLPSDAKPPTREIYFIKNHNMDTLIV